jgi:Uma2 family endonuclease
MTFAEFERLPDSREGRQELRHGELATVPPAKLLHYDTQRRLRRLLEAVMGSGWEIDIEMAFRPTVDHECWIADVAAVEAGRYASGRVEGYIQGSPEFVIEVLSPSNTATEMLDRRDVCLNNGARESWVVDPARGTVDVFTPGHDVSYRAGQQIPLAIGGSLAVDAVFA